MSSPPSNFRTKQLHVRACADAAKSTLLEKIYGCKTSQNAVDAEGRCATGQQIDRTVTHVLARCTPCARTVHGLFSKWSWAASVLHFQRAKRVRHVSRTAEHRLNSKTNAKALVQNHAHVADSHNTRFPSPRAGSLTHASCGI